MCCPSPFLVMHSLKFICYKFEGFMGDSSGMKSSS